MTPKRRANSFTEMEVRLAAEVLRKALYGSRPSDALVQRKEYSTLLNKFIKMEQAFKQD